MDAAICERASYAPFSQKRVIQISKDCDEDQAFADKKKAGKRMHIGFPDPPDAAGTEEEILAVFRETRDGFCVFWLSAPSTWVERGAGRTAAAKENQT
jgi:hypothetical protein